VDTARTITNALVERLRALSRSLSVPRVPGDVDPRVVDEMLLFGFLAAVVTVDTAIVFGVGDGIAWIDGPTTLTHPGPDNAPVYPAYALLGATITPRVLHASAAADVDAIAIATDGAEDLLAAESDPSFAAVVGDDRLLANPSLLGKRLLVLS